MKSFIYSLGLAATFFTLSLQAQDNIHELKLRFDADQTPASTFVLYLSSARPVSRELLSTITR